MAIAFIAILMILRELTIDIVPILTGAGIAGLAIGFGAQNLVRDIISGFFLILEDQVRVGDLARINGVAGMVEQINLRTIVRARRRGRRRRYSQRHHHRAGQSQQAVRLRDRGCPRGLRREHGSRDGNDAARSGRRCRDDPVWALVILSPLDVLGIESLADGAATLRVEFKTLPLNQGRVANELRRRLMATFMGRGIKPYARSAVQ